MSKRAPNRIRVRTAIPRGTGPVQRRLYRYLMDWLGREHRSCPIAVSLMEPKSGYDCWLYVRVQREARLNTAGNVICLLNISDRALSVCSGNAIYGFNCKPVLELADPECLGQAQAAVLSCLMAYFSLTPQLARYLPVMEACA